MIKFSGKDIIASFDKLKTGPIDCQIDFPKVSYKDGEQELNSLSSKLETRADEVAGKVLVINKQCHYILYHNRRRIVQAGKYFTQQKLIA